MDGLNSDLDLNGAAPPGVVPALGEWGPEGVPSTRAKRRQRWIVLAVLVLALTAVIVLGWALYPALRG